MITHNILNRVPGTTKPSKEIYVQNLSTYTMVQLCELRDRQLKLLQNKYVFVDSFAMFIDRECTYYS